MASLPNPKTVTYEEWLRMPEVYDQKEEVVNGEIRLMPAPKVKHAHIVRRISRPIDRQLDPDRFIVFTTLFGLVIRKAPLTVREPDLAVFEAATMVERDGYVHSAPSLIVEVLSPSNRLRNRQELMADYTSLGVPEFWFVWPEKRSIEVFRLGQDPIVVTEGVLTPQSLPGVQVPISEIWPD